MALASVITAIAKQFGVQNWDTTKLEHPIATSYSFENLLWTILLESKEIPCELLSQFLDNTLSGVDLDDTSLHTLLKFRHNVAKELMGDDDVGSCVDFYFEEIEWFINGNEYNKMLWDCFVVVVGACKLGMSRFVTLTNLDVDALEEVGFHCTSEMCAHYNRELEEGCLKSFGDVVCTFE